MIRHVLPESAIDSLRRWRARRAVQPPIGRVRFGALARLTPISTAFGYDRGQPIDRYYIERFLERHRRDIRGHVLEAGDRTYTTRFGGSAVSRSDVLDVEAGLPGPTIVGDLGTGHGIPRSTFQCIVLTQVLQYIYEAPAAIGHARDALRPGGVLLATFPGISQVSRYVVNRWGDQWRFTSLSARRAFDRWFPPENVEIESHGNVMAAAAFLYGLSAQDLTRAQLETHDPEYEVLITVRAVRPDSGAVGSESQ